MDNGLEKAVDKLVPSTENIFEWFSKPKEDARDYFVEMVKNNEDLTDDAKIALIYQSRKAVKELANCKSIYNEAINMFRVGTNKENTEINIETDWLNTFFDKAKLISNKDMQVIWSKILSEKMDNPDKVNLSLILTLSIISTKQANFFCNMSRFCYKDYNNEIIHPLIFISTNRKAYKSSGITDGDLRELHRLGLIEYCYDREFAFENIFMFVAGNKQVTVYGDKENENKIKAGNVVFTDDGMTLYSILDSDIKRYRSDILDFTVRKFLNRNCQVFINGKSIE